MTADKRGRKDMQDDDYPQARYLSDLFHAALTPKAQTFVDQGIEGTDVGKALREARLRAIGAEINAFERRANRLRHAARLETVLEEPVAGGDIEHVAVHRREAARGRL